MNRTWASDPRASSGCSVCPARLYVTGCIGLRRRRIKIVVADVSIKNGLAVAFWFKQFVLPSASPNTALVLEPIARRRFVCVLSCQCFLVRVFSGFGVLTHLLKFFRCGCRFLAGTRRRGQTGSHSNPRPSRIGPVLLVESKWGVAFEPYPSKSRSNLAPGKAHYGL